MSKQQGKKLSIPREIPDIQKEYQELVFNLGQANYQIFVLETEIKKMNDRLLIVNNEGAARNKLNEIQKAVAEGTEVKNESK